MIICVSACLYVSVYVHVGVCPPACPPACLHAYTCLRVSASTGVCVRASRSLAQMTLGNCSLSGGLSVHITVTTGGEGGDERSDLFHLPMPPLSF